VQRISEYTVGSVEELVAELSADGREVLLAGDGVERYRDEFAALDRAVHAGPQWEAPSATALIELATGRLEREEFTSPWEVSPLYLRESDAELAWAARR
jgi:tRNA A37 threonylcarbamoyladenosine modification protein TsaB